MKAPEINISDVMRRNPPTIQITVTGMRWFSFRLRIAAALVKIAARISGCKSEVIQ